MMTFTSKRARAALFRRAPAVLVPLVLAACATTSAPSPAVPTGPAFSLPMRLNGTEPFWGGRIAADSITLSGAERPELRLPATAPVITGAGARWVTPKEGALNAAPSTVVITATQAGATSDAMANNVARPIENALYNIDGVQRVSTTHMAGRSILTVAFTPGSAEARAQAVRTALRGVRLPARAAAEVTLARSQPVEITLVREACSDGMSDRRYPFQATVVMGGETLRGCAIPEAQMGAAR